MEVSTTRVKSRARGDKEPVGRTKAAILLFLADTGESTFTEVREHMLERYNIRNHKAIRTHLDELSNDDKLGLLAKKSNGNGNACSYRLREGFGSLKRLYNYLKAQGAGPELMQTAYFAEFTSSCDFFRKVKTNLMINILADLNQRMASEDGRASIRANMGHVSPEHRKIIVSWMERVGQYDMSDPLSRNFIRMVKVAGSPDAETVMDDYVKSLAERGIAVAGPDGFARLASDILIPDEYRDRITTIMRLSPGAFDCAMNLDCDNPLFPHNPFLAYATSLLLSMDELTAGTGLTVNDCCDYGKGLPRLVTEPPLYLIARSHFVSDLVNGRLAARPVPLETLRLIFT